MGGGREGESTFLWFPSWWVRLLFHKGPPGGGGSQQATRSGPSLGPDTPAASIRSRHRWALPLRKAKWTSDRSLTPPGPTVCLPPT